MTYSVNEQVFIFVTCLLCGVLVAVTFDVFRIIRRTVRSGMAVTSAQDILYWIVTAAVVFGFILVSNSGELRWFTIAGVMLGAFLYFVTISRFVVSISVYIIRVIKNIITVIIQFLLYPIKLVFTIMEKPAFFVFNIGRRRFRRIKYIVVENTVKFKKSVKKI